MKIEWNENPLKTKVFLNNEEKEKFKRKLLEEYEEDRVDIYHDLLKELEEGEHYGDCVCSACSCQKCYAEDLAGIDTILLTGKKTSCSAYLEKHSAGMIASSFGRYENIDQVFEDLTKSYCREHSRFEEWWLPHIERWNKERLFALEWLKAYHKEHIENDKSS